MKYFVWLVIFGAGGCGLALAQDKLTTSANQEQDTLILAAGCFWKLEYHLQQLEGILKTEVGFTGGRLPHPNYIQVSSGRTGHVEAVQIIYNPSQIFLEDILQVFWKMHNPWIEAEKVSLQTPRGASFIFYQHTLQKEVAQQLKSGLEKSRGDGQKIKTRILKKRPFYPASDKHQDYYSKRGGLPKYSRDCSIK